LQIDLSPDTKRNHPRKSNIHQASSHHPNPTTTVVPNRTHKVFLKLLDSQTRGGDRSNLHPLLQEAPRAKPSRNLVKVTLAQSEVLRDKLVIENVFCAIESSPALGGWYDALLVTFGKKVVNQMIGDWTRQEVNGVAIKEVPALRTTLTGSFSELTL
jgi:hypothetical protein